MATLYVDRKDTALRVTGGCVVLTVPGHRPRTVPVAHLDRVVLRARTTFDSASLGHLTYAGVAVVGLSGRHGSRTFQTAARGRRDASRRLAQYQACLSPEQTVRIAGAVVQAKLGGQVRVLRRAAARRPEHRRMLHVALRGALGALRAVAGAQTVDTLRGLEGAGAAAYFRGYTRLFAPSLGFVGRNRRPPRDPVNAVLSLSYTLLHARAVAACHAAGLDPMLGFLHAPAYGRESLACDLVELLRPHADEWVWAQFQTRALRGEHFVLDKGACLLGKAGRGHFYPRFEAAAPAWDRYLRAATQRLVRELAPLAPPLVDVREADLP